ncbi:deoxynucleoside triphosphate triphosphohydrolase SAMHD1-like [Asterias amurensis]|uniref:deoxynucleoside triphosphate triphosphohydrolase SAMHD1-like n=1 Tax=Asterias amurensis TaxID=7602 RepID=UPI003AB2D967
MSETPTAYQDGWKIFKDPIHGYIDMHPLCVKIIDTEEFQRLRYIKQLGFCYLVFPGAAHNRFEHSLGVGHLARKFCSKLQQTQPELGITDKDVLCVHVAGLCYDLGHGPFSHMFERFTKAVGKSRPHEQTSVAMFDHLIEVNQLEGEFKRFDLDEKDITFIKELIDKEEKKKESPHPRRPSFLYEIVANTRNGIDVDKWDYFLRDCHHLGIACSFDWDRYMECSCVSTDASGVKMICSREKEVENLYDLFGTRRSLHRKAYQHKVANIIEIMTVEALVEAKDHFKIQGKEGRMLTIGEAIDDMVAYTKLTDDVILQLMRSLDENLKVSREILKRVQKRQFYKYIGQARSKKKEIFPHDKIPTFVEEILSNMKLGAPLTEEQLVIDLVNFDYGMGRKNPIENVRFYYKENPGKAEFIAKEKVSWMLPKQFSEQQIRVYCKPLDQESVRKAAECVKKWCADKGYLYTGPGEFTIDVSSE